MSIPKFARTWTTCYSQTQLERVEVQVIFRKGLPRFDIIGLPQHMIREGKDRILSTLHSLQIELPAQRLLVSLLPGDRPKEGSHFDLPILIALFQALGLLPSPAHREFSWGELQLDGSLSPFDEALPHLFFADHPQVSKHILSSHSPLINDQQRFLNGRIRCIDHVEELFQDHVEDLGPQEHSETDCVLPPLPQDCLWNQIKGTPEQFLTWVLSLLGRHHILLMGSPGQGKSLWAKSAKDLMPPLPRKLWRERLMFQSHGCRFQSWEDLARRPYEAPHHKASASAIIGGGSKAAVAGALTRAHQGILFLDEFFEFHRDVLESLREPLEEKSLSIARQSKAVRLPANVQLIAATNPCPCGRYRSKQTCRCSTSDFNRYRAKQSGPLVDRFHRKLWWSFEDAERAKDFEAMEVRERIRESQTFPIAKNAGIHWPKLPNPRQQRLVLDKWATWLQWHEISTAGQDDFDRFWKFEQQWERKWHDSKELEQGLARRT